VQHNVLCTNSSVAASQFFSIFLAHPNAELTELDRWPLVVEAPTLCIACSQNREPDEPAMECERCDAPYHPSCLNPPLAGPPEGEWFCPKCMAESKQTFDDVPLADFAAHEASPSTPGAPESLKRPPSSQGFSAAPGKKLRAE
jgi:hypothetical protein